ncbi:hypothetical protein K504DRAFT_385503 [Pleomassaria siparia CBS 279.74]|uniref:Uncharacterized protein n=1 Tax=Pleomassaria siparia CBS 279.74 TaxID=1314801 RepID=A0A6G1K1U8_9PLEO|nr:hypothetical protein K504DRAFT_385503 [Pleomassaria siparia CBS 279.74]
MGKQFFTGWALWQKMTFVLACGIVATIIVGLIKVQYDNYTIRKYTKVEKGKKAQTPEMLEAQPVELLAQQDSKDGIPFGIRAIESGIEVDGVWISRSNTPVGSSASSITETRLPRSLGNSRNNSQLELPQATHGSSRNSSRAPSSFDLAVNAERIQTNDSRSSSPGWAYPTETSGRPPVTNSRYSDFPANRDSAALHALEGTEPGPSTTGKSRQLPKLFSNGSRTSDESDYMNLNDGRPYEPAYINPRYNQVGPSAVAVDPRMDLDLLQSHRLSHVAETGQLTPRVRRPGLNSDWPSQTDGLRSSQDVSTANGVDYFVPRQKTPSPPLRQWASPEEDAPMSSSSKFNQDGHASHQHRQAMPLLETYAPDAQKMHQPEAYQPRGPHRDYEDEFLPQDVATAQTQQRESQILRKVNSGFEILHPGTLGQPPNPEDQSAAASNELGERRQSKKLQKRRKSSSASRTSHFVEQV